MILAKITALWGWCAAINVAVLLLSWLALMACGNRVYSFHTRFFPMKKEAWDKVMYQSMAYYKITTFVFFVIPYIALRIVG